MSVPNIRNSKFTPNPLPDVYAPRNLLLRRIDEATEKQLVFVSAAAGFGKTVSVLLWIQMSGRKTVWIGLDAYDNSITVFYRMFCTGILSAQPDNGRLTAILQDPAFNSSPVEHTINLLAEFEDDGGLYALVLDDFHTITNGDIVKSLPFILRRMPHSFVTFVISRNAPQSTFSELLESGSAAIITADELTFTKDEIIEYCGMLGHAITSEEADAALSGTSGWAIGINVFSKSTADKPDAADFHIDKQPLLELYIRRHVWDHWDLPLRTFMIVSAVLDEMPVDLCVQITGRQDSGDLLESLHRQNAFVARIEDNVYRYHHLFLDFLRTQPEYEAFDKKRAFIAAAEYYLENDEVLLARRYAIESGDVKTIAEMQYAFTNSKDYSIDDYVSVAQYYLKSESALGLCEKNPILYISYAYVSWLTGDSKSFENYVDKLRSSLPKIMLRFPKFVESAYAIIALDYRTPFATLIKQVSRLPIIRFPGDEMRSSSISMQMPFTHRSTRDYYELTDESLFPGLKKTFGKLLKSHYEIIIHALKAGLFLEQNRASEALSEVLAARSLLTAQTVKEVRFAVNAHTAAVYYTLGQQDEFAAALDETERFVNENAQFLSPNFLAFKARVRLWNGDKNAATQWLGNYFVNESSTIELYKLYRYFTTVRAYAVVGDYSKAKDLAGRLRQLGQDYNRLCDTAEAGTLLAVLLRAEGKNTKAQEMLESVLAELQPHGFVSLISDEGAAVVPIVKKILGRVQKPDYSGALNPIYVNNVYLAAYAVSKHRAGIITELGSKPVRLSAQQQKILGFYAAGYRRENLVDLTGLSLNTIKTHTRILYEKLGTDNAADAVAKAKELGLLE